MGTGARALVVSLCVAIGLAAYAQQAPPAVQPTSVVESAKPIVTDVAGHFDPTQAVGQGANSSSAVGDAASVFASIQQASQLKIAASVNPPGSTGADVALVSIVAQDSGGLLKGMDSAAKRSLADALLTSASTAWPNASISLLISDPAGAGGTVIGNRPKGGPNTVIAS